jgi:hypothetical protein
MVIKYLTISQYDSYTISNKVRHLLVGHYVRDDVQSFNVDFNLNQDVGPKTLPSP